MIQYEQLCQSPVEPPRGEPDVRGAAVLIETLAVGLVVGLLMGVLGGGGGVLTVPILVYLLGESAHQATTGSLVIVGVAALVAVASRWPSGGVRWRTGVAMGVLGYRRPTSGRWSTSASTRRSCSWHSPDWS